MRSAPGPGHCKTKLNGNAMQPSISYPQFRSRRQLHGGQQVSVDIAESASEQCVPLDEVENFLLRGGAGMGQITPPFSTISP